MVVGVVVEVVVVRVSRAWEKHKSGTRVSNFACFTPKSGRKGAKNMCFTPKKWAKVSKNTRDAWRVLKGPHYNQHGTLCTLIFMHNLCITTVFFTLFVCILMIFILFFIISIWAIFITLSIIIKSLKRSIN